MAVTWNPSDKSANVTLSAANLVATWGASTASVRATASIAPGTKARFEVTLGTATASQFIGVANGSMPLGDFPGQDNNGCGYQTAGNIFINSASLLGMPTLAGGDVVGVYVDGLNGTIWFTKNGGLPNNSGTADPATNTGGISISALGAVALFPAWGANASNSATVNFGATAYAYSGYAGFGNVGVVSLTASNLTTSSPVIGSPPLTQVHSLTATNLTTGSPVLGAPVLAQPLLPLGLTTASPVIGLPGLVAGRVLALPVSSRVVTAYPVAQ